MPYVPTATRRRAIIRQPLRRRVILGTYVPQEHMGNLLDDLWGGVKTAVVTTVSQAESTFVSSAKQEAAAAASKAAISALQKKATKTTKTVKAAQPSTAAPSTVTTEHPAYQDQTSKRSTGATLPAEAASGVTVPPTTTGTLMKYAPYVVAAVGGVVVLVLIMRSARSTGGAK